jgi:cell division protease FtsH
MKYARLIVLAVAVLFVGSIAFYFAAPAGDPARIMFERAGMETTVSGGTTLPAEIDYSELRRMIDAKEVTAAVLMGSLVGVKTATGYTTTYLPYGLIAPVTERLAADGVRIKVVNMDGPTFLSIFLSFAPILIIIAITLLMMRRMGGGVFGMAKSKAKMIEPGKNAVGFSAVAGAEEAKDDLVEIVEFLKDPKGYGRLGGKIPKGVLLIGPPGTGKTLIARAVAGEAKVPFFVTSGSEFVEMFVGVGAGRARDLFKQARLRAPAIIFIDELDAIGRARGGGNSGDQEREQTLNQILVEMDGFDPSTGVIVIAATNRPEILDPALLRPGRFDRQVSVGLPDLAGRRQILAVHTAALTLAADVDLATLARGTPGFSGADLANLANEAALLAVKRKLVNITAAVFDAAKDKILMGAERPSLIMTEEEKSLTAYHEAGHALVSLYTKVSDPIHKATILPRGRSLGVVVRLPETDRTSMTRIRLESDIAMLMGGRVAEEIVFGHDGVTTGASSDIKVATNFARRMVTEWGMSDLLGAIDYTIDESTGKIPVGGPSDGLIHQEIKRIIDTGHEQARTILTQHRHRLNAIAEALLVHETLTGSQIRQIAEDAVLTTLVA